MSHPVDPAERHEWLIGGPIVLGENAWFGAGATILPGVTIGDDAVIAAGTVVADGVPPATLVIGDKGSIRPRWLAANHGYRTAIDQGPLGNARSNDAAQVPPRMATHLSLVARSH